jgi:hypothetical protein
MPRERLRPPDLQTVDIWGFALPALAEFATKAHAKGMPKPSRDDVASAAVWVCAQLPAEVCKAMVESYIAAEKEYHDEISRALEALFGRQ